MDGQPVGQLNHCIIETIDLGAGIGNASVNNEDHSWGFMKHFVIIWHMKLPSNRGGNTQLGLVASVSRK